MKIRIATQGERTNGIDCKYYKYWSCICKLNAYKHTVAHAHSELKRLQIDNKFVVKAMQICE